MMFSECFTSFILPAILTCVVSIKIDHFILNKKKESGKAKSSLTIIEKEIPWSDDKRKPKYHDDKFTVEKQHLNVTASSLGFPSRDQAPSSSFSTKANRASTQVTFSSHSVVLVSPSAEASSISISGLPKAIRPSLAPTMPGKRRSPPPPPNVPRTKPTFDAITKEPSIQEMQGDEGDIPSRHTRSTDENINITVDPSKQRAASSVSPSKYVVTVDMFDLNARGIVGGHTSTEFIAHHTLSGKEIIYFSEVLLKYSIPHSSDRPTMSGENARSKTGENHK